MRGFNATPANKSHDERWYGGPQSFSVQTSLLVFRNQVREGESCEFAKFGGVEVCMIDRGGQGFQLPRCLGVFRPHLHLRNTGGDTPR
jgi:hypothetical protein